MCIPILPYDGSALPISSNRGSIIGEEKITSQERGFKRGIYILDNVRIIFQG